MDDELIVDGFQGVDQAGYEETGNLHGEFASASDVVSEITAKEEVHDEIQIHGVLERIVDIHNELTLNQRQQLEFVHDTRYTFLGNNSRLGHLFHRKLIALIFLRLDAPDLSEASSTDRVDLLEVGFRRQTSAFLVFCCLKVTVSHDSEED